MDHPEYMDKRNKESAGSYRDGKDMGKTGSFAPGDTREIHIRGDGSPEGLCQSFSYGSLRRRKCKGSESLIVRRAY